MNGLPNAATATVPLHDPRRTERVGRRLAQRLRDRGITTVACWNTGEDLVLAHVVARELGAELRLANEVEGIVTLAEPLPAGAVVALVAESLQARNAVGGLAGVVGHVGARVAAVATARTPAEVADTQARDAAVVTAEER